MSSKRDQIIILTGSSGMIGYHMRCHLLARGYDHVFITQRKDLETQKTFQDFLQKQDLKFVDTVVHCAGVNRSDDLAEFEKNEAMAETITAAFHDQSPALIYMNTIQSEQDNAYGRSKKKAADIFSEWSSRCDSPFFDLVLPNIFGEYAKPFYNSVVATFSHQLFSEQTPKIIEDRDIQLLHVSHVCDQVIRLLGERKKESQQICFSDDITIMRVSSLRDRLQSFHASYVQNNIFPSMPHAFERKLFNTFRSFAPDSFFPRVLQKHTDERGYLIETVKAKSGGQGFTSLSYPGVVRGNHFHIHKVERFLVLNGHAEIQIRRLFDQQTTRIHVSGDDPCIVDIPTLHVHNIVNVGEENMLAQFWADEVFNPNDSDTYACSIEHGHDQVLQMHKGVVDAA